MNPELQRRLLETFRIEAREHIETMTNTLVALEDESRGNVAELIELIYREAHSLKGAARVVNEAAIESLCSQLESCFGAMKQGKVPFSPQFADVVHEAVAAIAAQLDGRGNPEQHRDIIARLNECELGREPRRRERAPAPTQPEIHPGAAAPGPAAAPVAAVELAAPHKLGIVRTTTEALDAVYRQTDAVQLASSDQRDLVRRARAFRETLMRVLPHKSELSTALEHDGVRAGTDYDSLLETLNEFVRDLAGTNGRLRETTKELAERVKQLQLTPFSTILAMFPKFVRDLSKEQQKRVTLDITGGDTKIDAAILQQLKDPLLHLVRNAIDHGIEPVEQRGKSGKSEIARLSLRVTQVEGGMVEILVRDDGRGIDTDSLRRRAAELGIMDADEATSLSEEAALDLVFHSGFSTSRKVSDISGRGLGLPIVRDTVRELGGMVECRTRPGNGTEFRLSLPLTIASFRAVLVEADEARYLVPTPFVGRVTRVHEEFLGQGGPIEIDGKTMSVLSLATVLHGKTPARPKKGSYVPVLVVQMNQAQLGFVVDRVVDEREIMMKNLGPQLRRVRHIGGAALLERGEPVLVLNIPELMQTALDFDTTPAISRNDTPAGQGRPSILVVEDSITSRMFLRDILAGAGYEVDTAVDGVDALSKLAERPFSLVMSDVDMPRMNGFELTKRIRADAKLELMPVILVTSLASEEDHERGMDAGASAYVVKSNFEQGDLLQVVEQFVS